MYFLKILVGIQNGSKLVLWERSGSVVAQCLSGRVLDLRVRASPGSLCCGPWARHIYPSLVPLYWFNPGRTIPWLTERLLMGRKELNQTITSAAIVHWFNDVMEINTCNSLLDEKQLFSHSTKNVLLCNNLCPVCTHIQVAFKKVISTFSHELAIFNNKRFNTFNLSSLLFMVCILWI